MDLEGLKDKARRLLLEFKGENYAFGLGVLKMAGEFGASFGKSALVISNATHVESVASVVVESLQARGAALAGGRIWLGARPNAPREDVYRMESYILHFKPDCIVPIGGGSTIDAAKAADVLAVLGGYEADIDAYFGTGLVTKALKETGKSFVPIVAVQTSASSGAHLTKYSNVTDPIAGQKKLIVDDAIVPPRAVFDYGVTTSMPLGVTVDGIMDAISHCLEVFYGASGEAFDKVAEVALTGIELAVGYAKKVLSAPRDLEVREGLGLATDLGGYAIMIGGTNGAHLTSFSLVDITSHGRACGLMNPYYTVFFAPAIERQLKLLGEIFNRAGYMGEDLKALRGRELGVAVAKGMVAFAKDIGAPTKLADLPGFSDEHIKRALEAAKDPQLGMKLKNMPVPLSADLVDEYMAPILEAAKVGDFTLIKNM